jgi:hypothetical protein
MVTQLAQKDLGCFIQEKEDKLGKLAKMMIFMDLVLILC